MPVNYKITLAAFAEWALTEQDDRVCWLPNRIIRYLCQENDQYYWPDKPIDFKHYEGLIWIGHLEDLGQHKIGVKLISRTLGRGSDLFSIRTVTEWEAKKGMLPRSEIKEKAIEDADHQRLKDWFNLRGITFPYPAGEIGVPIIFANPDDEVEFRVTWE